MATPKLFISHTLPSATLFIPPPHQQQNIHHHQQQLNTNTTKGNRKHTHTYSPTTTSSNFQFPTSKSLHSFDPFSILIYMPHRIPAINLYY